MMIPHAPTSIRLHLASPETIRSWSYGEVRAPLTLNYLTLQPEREGLLSEEIFGPVVSWSCACGKYQRARRPGFRCEVCGVELCERTVRRERMGHIELAAPVAHPWFAKRTPNSMALLLGVPPRLLHAVLTSTCLVVLSIDEEERARHLASSGQNGSKRHAALTHRLRTLREGDVLESVDALAHSYGTAFRAERGAGAVREWLARLDLDALARELRARMAQSGSSSPQLVRRLQIVEALRASGTDPSWMILSVLPVLPPDLRPVLPLSGGRMVSSDLNALYERILHRNQRIADLQAAHAPQVIMQHEERLLQEACDALLDNGHRARPALGPQGAPLKSLTERISGKHGRLRAHLLGKRVDYSGRSVIVGDPSLKLQQCGLPTAICLELFKPFLMRKLVERAVVSTPRAAKRLIERPRLHTPLVWDLLAEVMYERVVLLNRAPTLHRLSIQAFEPVRTLGQAIHLHPLVCSAFNADFDGDQMAVHLLLSEGAQREARTLLLSTRNLRSAVNGEPAISISQEMVLGLFYLTQARPSAKQRARPFADATEALLALSQGSIDLHTPIIVRSAETRVYEVHDGTPHPLPPRHRLETTAGRLLFNEVLPARLRYRNHAMTKDVLRDLLATCLETCGSEETARLADALKQLGYRYATKSGISVALSDIVIPSQKATLLAQAEVEAQAIETPYQGGLMTGQERARLLIAHWGRVTEEIAAQMEACQDPWGSLSTIITSGATKAKFQQIRQLAGMRGLLARPTGQIIEVPVKTNYKEGMTVSDAYGAGSAARNGFAARSLSTATTGYLTRRLVETGMEVWVTMQDCGTRENWLLTEQESRARGMLNMQPRLIGRVLAESVAGLPAGRLLDRQRARHLIEAGVEQVQVRSVLCCQAPSGVCRRCYGSDLATGTLVPLGMAVGVIAGQSIGEPGTQLSMKAFHSGGIAHAQGDIRQGLPRVIALFEARVPRVAALLAPYEGHVSITDAQGETHLSIHPEQGSPQEVWHGTVPRGQKPVVEHGAQVEVGTALSDGVINPHELLALRGCEATARYLLGEIQQVFSATGVFIHDKHVECLLRQMLRFVRVVDPGDTRLLPGSIVDRFQVQDCVAEVLAQGGQPAIAHPILLGLTKAALQTASWLAAASFQETSRVLTQAALAGQVDPLVGFKERVIVGLPVPHPAFPVADEEKE